MRFSVELGVKPQYHLATVITDERNKKKGGEMRGFSLSEDNVH